MSFLVAQLSATSGNQKLDAAISDLPHSYCFMKNVLILVTLNIETLGGFYKVRVFRSKIEIEKFEVHVRVYAEM